MEINWEVNGNAAIYYLRGEMDLYTSQDVRERFREALTDNYKRIILDCRDLTYLDSSGIGVLIALFTTMRKKGGKLSLCCLQKSVETVITFTKLTGFLHITKTQEEALNNIKIETTAMKEQKKGQMICGIIQDDSHPLFQSSGMYHKEFNLDLRKVRKLSQLILQKAPPEIREINLLEQQISEIIKNAVRHGNRNDPNKKIKIWFSFDKDHAHLIVQDEGSGFKNVENWNDFYAQKMKAFETRNIDKMMEYISYRTEDSRENDGGNALFAAVEFWNRGVVVSERGNSVAVKRDYT